LNQVDKIYQHSELASAPCTHIEAEQLLQVLEGLVQQHVLLPLLFFQHQLFLDFINN